MSRYFPRGLLVEALGNNPRLIAAFEQLDEAVEAFETQIADLEARAKAIGESVEFQPRNTILDALSNLAADSGVIEQVSDGQFSIRSVDDPDNDAALLTKARASTLYAPHP